jgi:hypothetical protein
VEAPTKLNIAANVTELIGERLLRACRGDSRGVLVAAGQRYRSC